GIGTRVENMDGCLHIVTVAMLRHARAAYHTARIALDPSRLDHVFGLAQSLRSPAATRYLVELFSRTDEGRRSLRTRPRIAPVDDLGVLARLPEGTLGRAYADYFATNGVDPATFMALGSATPEEFVYAHIYESHDVWHVVTGFDTDLVGEIGLQ